MAEELSGPSLARAVLADNRRMLDLIARFGAIAERNVEQGVVELVFTAPLSARATPR